MLGYVLAFIFSVAVFVVLVSVVLPRTFLKLKCSAYTEDRGIERIKGDDFYGIVYLPCSAIRDKVDRYVIIDRNGNKFLQLNLNDKIRYVDYDVIAFSRSGRILDVLRVKDVALEKGFSSKTQLPPLTAYVSIRINETDAGKESSSIEFRVPKSGIAWYCAFTTLALIAESLVVKFCLANLFGGLFNESFMTEKTIAGTIIIISALSIVSGITLWFIVRGRTKR